jgi:hypothetical protein
MKTDIEIAQEATLLPIKEVAANIGIKEDDLELYGKYNDAPSFNKIRIDLLEKELKELEEVASEENKKERLEKMRDLYKLYKTENMSKEERAIIKKGKALAGIEPEKKPAKGKTKKSSVKKKSKKK